MSHNDAKDPSLSHVNNEYELMGTVIHHSSPIFLSRVSNVKVPFIGIIMFMYWIVCKLHNFDQKHQN